LPDNIKRIAAQIPNCANITAERLINETTIYPLLKPFLPRDKGENLFEAMKYGNTHIYNIAGFSHIQTFVQRYLRYCERCVQDDCDTYGEPFWHRLHQISGIFVCHKHGTTLTESSVDIADVRIDYYPLLQAMDGAQLGFDPELTEKMVKISLEVEWLLQNAGIPGYYENTNECYDRWLRFRGFRDHNGKTGHKKLAEALVDYYGQEFLSMFDAYNSGACSWLRKTVLHRESLQHPIYHILLIHFLAGSVNEFFLKAAELKVTEYLPFGTPPYPCRNNVCDYHLQDVIEHIGVTKTHGVPRATFVCPHCGFSYRRKGNVPKEKQYTGQIDILDYGLKWREKLKAYLIAGISIKKTAKALNCDTRTAIRLGVELGLFPNKQIPHRLPYTPVTNSVNPKPDFLAKREQYRQRWLAMIEARPNITRNELLQRDSKCYAWLCENDRDWYEENSPLSKKFLPKWSGDDDEFTERIKNAMNQIRDAPGKPKRISISAIGKMIGDRKIHRKLASGRLPKSKSLIDANAETLEDWQRRKILWAIQDLREQNEVLTVHKVRYHATIEDKKRRWDDFIQDLL